MKVEFVIFLAIQRSIWCVVLHFGINKAIGGNVLLNFERKIRYLLSSITQLTRILSSSLSAEKSPKFSGINFCDLRGLFSSFQKVLTLLQ